MRQAYPANLPSERSLLLKKHFPEDSLCEYMCTCVYIILFCRIACVFVSLARALHSLSSQSFLVVSSADRCRRSSGVTPVPGGEPGVTVSTPPRPSPLPPRSLPRRGCWKQEPRARGHRDHFLRAAAAGALAFFFKGGG